MIDGGYDSPHSWHMRRKLWDHCCCVIAGAFYLVVEERHHSPAPGLKPHYGSCSQARWRAKLPLGVCSLWCCWLSEATAPSTTQHVVAMLPAWLVYISTVGQSPGNLPCASDDSTMSRLRPPELLASCQHTSCCLGLAGLSVFLGGAAVHMPCTAAGQD